jgi:hypothetical protein
VFQDFRQVLRKGAWEFRSHGQFRPSPEPTDFVGREGLPLNLRPWESHYYLSDQQFESKTLNDDFVISYG